MVLLLFRLFDGQIYIYIHIYKYISFCSHMYIYTHIFMYIRLYKAQFYKDTYIYI